MGTTRVLHNVFIQTQCVGEWKRMLYAVWSAHGLEGAQQSQYSLLFLYCAPYSKWYVHEEKSTLVYPNLTSEIQPVPHGVGRSVPESPDNFAMYSDDEDSLSSNSDEQQPSAPRDADYLPSTDTSNHKITKGKLNDLIVELELPKRRQNFWHQVMQ